MSVLSGCGLFLFDCLHSSNSGFVIQLCNFGACATTQLPSLSFFPSDLPTRGSQVSSGLTLTTQLLMANLKLREEIKLGAL